MADQLDEIGMPGRDLVDTVNRVQLKLEDPFNGFCDQVTGVGFAQEADLAVERLLEETSVSRLHILQLASGRTDREDEIELPVIHQALENGHKRQGQPFLGGSGL